VDQAKDDKKRKIGKPIPTKKKTRKFSEARDVMREVAQKKSDTEGTDASNNQEDP